MVTKRLEFQDHLFEFSVQLNITCVPGNPLGSNLGQYQPWQWVVVVVVVGISIHKQRAFLLQKKIKKHKVP